MAPFGFDSLYETARALGEETRFRIYRLLCTSGRPASVTDLAGRFDLHPNAIRGHLARLEQAGLLVSRLDRSTGAGRPRRLYEPSPEPLEFSPPRSLRPLVRMLSGVVDALPADRRRLREFGRTWGRTWMAERRAGNGALPRGRRARAELLARMLFEWGWQPSSSQQNGAVRLTTTRCLFHELVGERDGRCCALEDGLMTGLVDGMLNGGAQVRRLPGCRFQVSL